MSGPGEQEIGARLRAWRHYRRLSLEEVAGLAGITAPYLSRIERGLRPLDKLSTRAALARALGVSTADLAGLPLAATDTATERAHAAVAGVRLALVDTAAGVPGGTGDADLTGALDRFRALRDAGTYDELALSAPYLIGRLAADARTAELAEVLGTTSTMLRNLGYLDLALIAAQRAQTTARAGDDPVLSALSAWWVGKALIPAGATGTAVRVQTDALEALAGQRDTRARQSAAALHLNLAWAYSIAGSKGDAFEQAGSAGGIALRQGTAPLYVRPLLGGGVTVEDVGVCQVSLAVELGEPEAAVDYARGLDLGRLDSPARVATYWADLGRALSTDRRRAAESVRALTTAESLTPQRVRASASLRETVAGLLGQARRSAGGRDLVSLASRMGVE